MSILKYLSIICLVTTYSYTDDIPDQLDLKSLVDQQVYSIPSPNELLSATSKRGITLNTSPFLELFRYDLKNLSKTSPLESAFLLGRMFAIGGITYENVSNENILQMAKVLYSNIQTLPMPKPILQEISNLYRKFINHPNLKRDELILSFTEARSLLIQELNHSFHIQKKELILTQSIGSSLEFGMWLQSTYLALDAIKKPSDISIIRDIYLLEDILNYFDHSLKKVQLHNPHSLFLRSMKKTFQDLKKISIKKDLNLNDISQSRSLLKSIYF